MASRARVDSAIKGLDAYQKQLDKLAAGRAKIKKSEIQDPFLAEVAGSRVVTTGCSSSALSYASVNKMKKALESIGVTMAGLDSNQDGEIGYAKAQRLSPLGVHLLDAVAEGKVPRTRTRRQPTATDPAPTRTPARAESSGC